MAGQPILNAADAKAIDAEYSKRSKCSQCTLPYECSQNSTIQPIINTLSVLCAVCSLLSVDDLVVALHETLESLGEWNRSYVIFSSDHGYSQGQVR